MELIRLNGVLPILILTGVSLLVLVVEAFFERDKERRLAFILSLTGIIATLVSLFSQLVQHKARILLFGGSLIIDHTGLVFSIIICFGALLVVLLTHRNISKVHKSVGEFYSLILFATLGMHALTISNDMMTFFVSLEVMSIAVYILAGVNRKSLKSNESSLKYLILGAFSTAFLLLGISFVYGATGEMGFMAIKDSLMNPANSEFTSFGVLGLALIMVSFIFKIGAFPFQQWVPDVYEGAPSVVTAFMATCVKTAAFAILVRGLLTFFQADGSGFLMNVLTIITALTMVFGNFMALIQSNIKRLIAYSGIAHTGYLLLAILAFSSDPSEPDITPILFYLFVYTFMTIGVLAVLIGASRAGEEVETFEDIRGLGYKNKLLGLCMAFFFFSLAGIPSTAGFMGKFFIFKAAISKELYALALIGILTAVVSVYYYLKVVVYLYLKEENRRYERYSIQWNYLLVSVLTFLLTLFFGIFPQFGFKLLKL